MAMNTSMAESAESSEPLAQTFLYVSQASEPHAKRRAAILHAHPEVRDLQGAAPITARILIVLVLCQLMLSLLFADAPWWAYLLSAATIGAVASHALFGLVHECIHGTVFRSPWLNRALAIVANLPHALPSAVSFQIFHLEHHAHQGDYARDADIPAVWEVRLFGKSFLGKLAWFFVYPALMIARSSRVSKMSGVRGITLGVVVNVVCVLSFDAAWAYFAGWKALAWLLLSFYLAIGPTPLGARWVQEHFVLSRDQETNSYTGAFNLLCFNMGMHNEHNDFPGIPWFRLPKLRNLAPEFYSDLYDVTSYTVLFWRFLFDSRLSIGSRVVRAKDAMSVPFTLRSGANRQA